MKNEANRKGKLCKRALIIVQLYRLTLTDELAHALHYITYSILTHLLVL